MRPVPCANVAACMALEYCYFSGHEGRKKSELARTEIKIFVALPKIVRVTTHQLIPMLVT